MIDLTSEEFKELLSGSLSWEEVLDKQEQDLADEKT